MDMIPAVVKIILGISLDFSHSFVIMCTIIISEEKNIRAPICVVPSEWILQLVVDAKEG